MQRDWQSPLALCLLVIVWGSAFGLTTFALQGFSAVEVSFGRTFLAAIVVSLVAISTGQGLPQGLVEWKWLSALGVFGLAIPVTMLAWSQKTISSGVAAICISAVPLFILLLTRIVLKEPVSQRKWIGFAIGFAGLIWLAGPAAIQEIGKEGQVFAQIICIFTSVFYAIGAIIIKLMPSIPPFRATAGSMISGTVFLAPFGYSAFGATTDVQFIPLIALIALGVFPSGVGQLIRYFTVKRRGPVYVSIVGYLLPIWAGFVGYIFLGEVLSPSTILAYCVIITGIIIARDRNP